jgi:hypothetical protein
MGDAVVLASMRRGCVVAAADDDDVVVSSVRGAPEDSGDRAGERRGAVGASQRGFARVVDHKSLPNQFRNINHRLD